MDAIYAIPHDGCIVPNEELKYFEVDLEAILKLNEELRDKDVSKLFSGAKHIVKSDISRYIVDVERFEDDSLEEMSRIGMGVCYTKDHYGNNIRILNDEHKSFLINKYYREYHKRLTEAVDNSISNNGMALIIDCHSFNSELNYIGYSGSELPDVCIGYSEYHRSKRVEKIIEHQFTDSGYSVLYNKPFAGSIVPLRYYNKDSRVKSVMIEINKRVYINNKDNFKSVKKVCDSIIRIIDNIE